MAQEFIERHVAQGTMTYPTFEQIRDNPGQPHASVYVCENPECMAEAAEWVRSITGHPGEFYPFPARRPTDPFFGIDSEVDL